MRFQTLKPFRYAFVLGVILKQVPRVLRAVPRENQQVVQQMQDMHLYGSCCVNNCQLEIAFNLSAMDCLQDKIVAQRHFVVQGEKSLESLKRRAFNFSSRSKTIEAVWPYKVCSAVPELAKKVLPFTKLASSSATVSCRSARVRGLVWHVAK